MKKFGIVFLLWLLAAACSKDEAGNTLAPETPEQGQEVAPGEKYIPQGKYNLTVVYFIPSDMDTLPAWHRRLSGITLHAQDFYRNNMQAYGYGDKTFRLVLNERNPKYVKMTCLRGKKVAKDYNTGSVKDEVLAYLKQYPDERFGNHVVIYSPFGLSTFHGTYDRIGTNQEVSDMGFAVVSCDSPDFDIAYLNNPDLFSKHLNLLGGVLHEMGHGFFLPHDSQKATDKYISLMNNGNNFYISGNVMLTPGDAMWLNQVQVFNDIDREYYQETPRVEVQSVRFGWADKKIVLDCRFASSQKIIGFIAYNDFWRGQTNGSVNDRDDRDEFLWTEYDAINYSTAELNQSGSIYNAHLEIPWQDVPVGYTIPLPGQQNAKAEIRLRFVFEGGLSVPIVGKTVKGGKTLRFPYEIVNGFPNIAGLYEKLGWIITASSTPAVGHGVRNLIDDTDSEWVAEGDGPHVATIDMGQVVKVKSVVLNPGFYLGETATRRAKKVTLSGKGEGGDWISLAENYEMNDKEKEIYEVVCGDKDLRYLRLELKEAWNGEKKIGFQELSIKK